MIQTALGFLDDVMARKVDVSYRDLHENDWAQVVFAHLLRSRDALRAIRLITTEGLRGPSIVLHRYIFELAINLMYLRNDVENRLHPYLEHGGLLLTPDDVADIGDKLESLQQERDYAGVMELTRTPRRPWKSLKEMCEDVGMTDDYNTLYRSASDVAHGGVMQYHWR